jgi:capsule polysaccharide export protein KpsE/RkpR
MKAERKTKIEKSDFKKSSVLFSVIFLLLPVRVYFWSRVSVIFFQMPVRVDKGHDRE